MKITSIANAISVLMLAAAAAKPVLAAGPATQPTPRPAEHLVWADEFNGNTLDRSKWAFDIGNGGHGWGNNELEYYTDRTANAYVANGMLHVRAIHENRNGFQYTSARLRTGGTDRTGAPALFARAYGRFEFRAKLPAGQGMWPALWLLPQGDPYGTWAASGEIDILENKGFQPGIVQGTIHFGGSSPRNVWIGQEYRLPDNGRADDWHVYALDWTPGRMEWSIDGTVYATRDNWFSQTSGHDKPNPWPAPFDKPFFILINLAIGGNFGGNPNAQTKFPQEMLVDYVRVYQRDAGPGELAPPGEESVHQSVVYPPVPADKR